MRGATIITAVGQTVFAVQNEGLQGVFRFDGPTRERRALESNDTRIASFAALVDCDESSSLSRPCTTINRVAPVKRGRPRTAEQIRQWVIRLARENNWGYARIVGELKKLGIRSIKKSTVRNILKAEGFDPCPKRSGTTWDEFITRHAASLWQADFFTQKVLTSKGFRKAFVLAFLNMKTQRVVLSSATFHPDAAWVTTQAELLVHQARGQGLRVRYVQRDRDGKYGEAFEATMKKLGAETILSPAKSPNRQAFVERFIGSIRSECLNHFIFFGTKHLDSVARSWLAHYHEERPHQGIDIGNQLLIRPPNEKPSAIAADATTLRGVCCRPRLGGLLKHYERRAA